MKASSKYAAAAALVLAAAWLTAVWTALVAPVHAQGGAAPQMSEQVFKNIQVLKGIPVDEFMGTMGVFTTSLNLCCGDCHTGAGTANPKWEADPPRKVTARRMVQMVDTINKTNFGGRKVVTCWTCHRGQKSPAVTPPLDAAYGEPNIVPPDLLLAAPASAAAPSLDQVFNKFTQALGGQAATNAMTSYSAKGRSLLYGEVGDGDPAELYAKAPNQFAAMTHQREGDVARTFDGTTAWWQQPLTVTPQFALTGTLLEGMRFEAALAFPWRIREFFTNWRVSFPTTLDGTAVDVVQGNTPAGMIATLYFDKQSGLLKRMVRYASTAVGRVPTQIDYAEYRAVAGVMMPFKFTYTWAGSREEWTLTDYQANVAVDASKFGKPAGR